MTVSSEVSKVTYVANGSTTAWSFVFSVTQPSDVLVFVMDPNGILNQIPLGQYTVNVNAPIDPNPTPAGGTVIYPLSGPPLAIGNTIVLFRNVPEIQPVSIANQSIIYPPIVEQSFDREIMIDQQVTEMMNRAVKVNIGEAPLAPLPSLALRANQQAVFNSAGDLVGGGVIVGTIISPVMIPVVTAATLPLARTAMGVAAIDSPVFTGNPQAPTPPPTDNDTTIATTAFVQAVGATLGVLIPSGTRMLFQQTAAPTGWTKDITNNDKALRVVTGAVGSGGTSPFSTVFSKTGTDAHTLIQNEMPPHSHGVVDPGHLHFAAEGIYFTIGPGSGIGFATGPDFLFDQVQTTTASATGIFLQNAGGGGSHDHTMDLRVQYVDVIIASKN